MAMQASGAISLSEIQAEHGGVYAASLSEYYLDADPSLVSSNNTGVPNTGSPISFSDFYSTEKRFIYSFTSSVQEINLSTHLVAQGWNGSSVVDVTVNSGVYIWSDSTATAAMTIPSSMNGLVTITNNGYIIGKGGRGSGYETNAENGGPAISNSATGVSLTNASGAFIAGGGGGGTGGAGGDNIKYGGGGGGAGGGEGGGNAFNSYGGGGAGGAIGQAGSNGSSGSYGESGTLGAAQGGGAGGGGGAYDGDGSDKTSSTGAGGGRILGAGATGGAGGTATGGVTGGSGGANGDAGSEASAASSGGGGGWGAAGARGNGSGLAGAGGAAISGTSIAVTNNGTIYGSQA